MAVAHKLREWFHRKKMKSGTTEVTNADEDRVTPLPKKLVTAVFILSVSFLKMCPIQAGTKTVSQNLGEKAGQIYWVNYLKIKHSQGRIHGMALGARANLTLLSYLQLFHLHNKYIVPSNSTNSFELPQSYISRYVLDSYCYSVVQEDWLVVLKIERGKGVCWKYF